MITEILVAFIGAIGGIIAAVISKPRLPKNGELKMFTEKQPLRARLTFIWVAAPFVGAIFLLSLLYSFRVLATPPVLKAPFCINGYFFPSGWMGDGESKDTKYIDLNDQWKENCHSTPTCMKITYRPGPSGWAGVYWQYPDKNWGDEFGRKIEDATKLVFWARGEKGGELVEFKIGGINDPKAKYHDSLEKTLHTVELKTQWQCFEIDLTGSDTSSVIGAFAWVANRNGNPQGLTFYLDDIYFR